MDLPPSPTLSGVSSDFSLDSPHVDQDDMVDVRSYISQPPQFLNRSSGFSRESADFTHVLTTAGENQFVINKLQSDIREMKKAFRRDLIEATSSAKKVQFESNDALNEDIEDSDKSRLDDSERISTLAKVILDQQSAVKQMEALTQELTESQRQLAYAVELERAKREELERQLEELNQNRQSIDNTELAKAVAIVRSETLRAQAEQSMVGSLRSADSEGIISRKSLDPVMEAANDTFIEQSRVNPELFAHPFELVEDRLVSEGENRLPHTLSFQEVLEIPLQSGLTTDNESEVEDEKVTEYSSSEIVLSDNSIEQPVHSASVSPVTLNCSTPMTSLSMKLGTEESLVSTFQGDYTDIPAVANTSPSIETTTNPFPTNQSSLLDKEHRERNFALRETANKLKDILISFSPVLSAVLPSYFDPLHRTTTDESVSHSVTPKFTVFEEGDVELAVEEAGLLFIRLFKLIDSSDERLETLVQNEREGVFDAALIDDLTSCIDRSISSSNNLRSILRLLHLSISPHRRRSPHFTERDLAFLQNRSAFAKDLSSLHSLLLRRTQDLKHVHNLLRRRFSDMVAFPSSIAGSETKSPRTSSPRKSATRSVYTRTSLSGNSRLATPLGDVDGDRSLALLTGAIAEMLVQVDQALEAVREFCGRHPHIPTSFHADDLRLSASVYAFDEPPPTSPVSTHPDVSHTINASPSHSVNVSSSTSFSSPFESERTKDDSPRSGRIHLSPELLRGVSVSTRSVSGSPRLSLPERLSDKKGDRKDAAVVGIHRLDPPRPAVPPSETVSSRRRAEAGRQKRQMLEQPSVPLVRRSKESTRSVISSTSNNSKNSSNNDNTNTSSTLTCTTTAGNRNNTTLYMPNVELVDETSAENNRLGVTEVLLDAREPQGRSAVYARHSRDATAPVTSPRRFTDAVRGAIGAPRGNSKDERKLSVSSTISMESSGSRRGISAYSQQKMRPNVPTASTDNQALNSSNTIADVTATFDAHISTSERPQEAILAPTVAEGPKETPVPNNVDEDLITNNVKVEAHSSSEFSTTLFEEVSDSQIALPIVADAPDGTIVTPQITTEDFDTKEIVSADVFQVPSLISPLATIAADQDESPPESM